MDMRDQRAELSSELNHLQSVLINSAKPVSKPVKISDDPIERML